MKKLLVIALMLIMALSLAACGETDDSAALIFSEDKLDLSKYTAAEIPECDYVEDYMIPAFGVVTEAANETKAAQKNFNMTVAGYTTAQVEAYEKVLADNGMTAESKDTWKNDKIQLSISYVAAGVTEDSELLITIVPK
jgi:uncharacterized lipoprotein YehR (DUF1307 family)